MKTYFTPVEKIERKWYVADADGKTLGRVAAEVAVLLRGKHKLIILDISARKQGLPLAMLTAYDYCGTSYGRSSRIAPPSACCAV